jgi:hypothetical protein
MLVVVVRVFIASHPLEAHMIRGVLEADGIDAVVRGEALFAVRGLTPVTPDTLPSVWVMNDADADRALALLGDPRRVRVAETGRDRAWRCPACNEFVGPELAVCWQCGHAEPADLTARRA